MTKSLYYVYKPIPLGFKMIPPQGYNFTSNYNSGSYPNILRLKMRFSNTITGTMTYLRNQQEHI